eukprot:1097856-Rhodomonas_salina.3
MQLPIRASQRLQLIEHAVVWRTGVLRRVPLGVLRGEEEWQRLAKDQLPRRQFALVDVRTRLGAVVGGCCRPCVPRLAETAVHPPCSGKRTPQLCTPERREHTAHLCQSALECLPHLGGADRPREHPKVRQPAPPRGTAVGGAAS